MSLLAYLITVATKQTGLVDTSRNTAPHCNYSDNYYGDRVCQTKPENR